MIRDWECQKLLMFDKANQEDNHVGTLGHGISSGAISWKRGPQFRPNVSRWNLQETSSSIDWKWKTEFNILQNWDFNQSKFSISRWIDILVIKWADSEYKCIQTTSNNLFERQWSTWSQGSSVCFILEYNFVLSTIKAVCIIKTVARIFKESVKGRFEILSSVFWVFSGFRHSKNERWIMRR